MASPTRRRHSHYDSTRIDHILDMTPFAPQHINTDEGRQSALVALDRSWWQDELEPLELTVRALMGGLHNLFEYVVAISLDEERYDRFIATLERTFPSTASGFVSSLASDILRRLREFYIRLVCPDVPRSLDECHRAFELASNALKALNDLKFDLETPISTQEHIELAGVKTRQSQRKNKNLKRQSRNAFITDSTPFSAINAEIPHTKEQASSLEKKILEGQRITLLEYLRTLRLPGLCTAIERLYILSESPNELQSSSSESPTSEVKGHMRGTSISSEIHPVEVHPAYPQIQPLKAAKYFSEPAEGFGHWNLLLSNRAIHHLKGFRRDENTTWAIIKKKMQELSNGFFSDSNQKRLKGSDQGIPIYEAKMTRDLRLIYQIDLAPDDATGKDRQVVKIWGIYTHAQMDNRLWDSILYHQSKIGGEYRRRCIHRETAKRPGNNVILPASWDDAVEKLPAEDIRKIDKPAMTTEEQLNLHSILALEKFTRMSQALMNSIVAGQDDTYPFELTGAEQEIRDHPSSCFVLGRSGTGKTTTMVFKMVSREMLSIQQEADIDGPPTPKYRQLFVTQSRILAGRVQEYFAKMLMTQSAGQKTSQEIERLALRNQRASDGDDMLDIEDEDEERSDLPKKFSELEDHHFPLFLTVDQLSKLLESDLNLSFKRRPRTKEHRRAEQQSLSVETIDELVVLDDDDLAKDEDITNLSSPSDRVAEKASIITFETFFYTYWPHFPQPLTKGLDPALVWNEFMGVIKGSEESLHTEDGANFLNKETYLNLSHRRQSTFAKQRERIYSIFECYVKLKGRRGDYDAADRTHTILSALNGALPGGRKVDFLYVDEAQDNLIVDARLLRLLCGNPHGLFWAGDTAQTISMGSSFRFDDLKSFLYRLETQSCGNREPIHPESFQLAINYRSHAGVVDCAHSVVRLISKFWPDSLDVLARERGVVDGPRPVFFCGWDAKVARYEQFLFHESGNIEFGAQQCILVRDENAREDLRREIGDVGLIMTLYESKGLEFNDVLLFNFFSDSTASLAEWRVILNAVEESQRNNVGVPKFDETRHSSLCSELKSLYVGITRARCHVWILDIPKGGEERGEPMRVFWESKGLIKTCSPGDVVPELAVHSTPEQWAQQGRALFKTKHFQLAMFCFERAGLQLERFISHAYLLRRAAQRIPGPGRQKNAAYLRAAEAFMVCGGLSIGPARSRYLGLGADCFVSAGVNASAAQAYLAADNFAKAAEYFKSARLFDEAADVAIIHRRSVDPALYDQCISIARLHLHREHQHKKAARLFESIDHQLAYLDEYGFDVARAAVLEDLGRLSDAAEIHYVEGRPLEAIHLWISAGDPVSRRRAMDGLLNSLWATLPLGSEPCESQQGKLLQLLRNLAAEFAEDTQRDECAMFLAIFANDRTELLRLAREFHHGQRRNTMAALLCFDHALKKPPQMRNDSGPSVAIYLHNYDSYAHLMHKVILDSQKHQHADWFQAAKLLAFTRTNYEPAAGALTELHVLPTSILYESLKTEDLSPNDAISVTLDRLTIVIRQVLGQRLRERLWEEDKACRLVKSLRPCINFTVHGTCGRVECSQEHLPRHSMIAEAFHLRTRLHMQQVLIVHHMAILLDYHDRRKLHRIWQERLYETLFPIFYAFGNVSLLKVFASNSLESTVGVASSLSISSIPEYQRALGVLSNWLRDRFYSLRPDREYTFLTDAVQTAMLSFAMDRHNAAQYLWRAPCVVNHQYPRLRRKEGYIVHDLLTFLESSTESSIASGVLFIKHVLEHHVPIDTNTLLNMLEALIGRIVIVHYHSQQAREFTLPRTWIVNLLSNWDERCKTPNLHIIRFLFGPLADLLQGIYTNKEIDYLMYEGRSLKTHHIHSTARTIMIFRICKSLALLGYNIPNQAFRDDVGRTLTSLSKLGRNFHSLISPYVKAGEWKHLARAVRSSTEPPLDELITLRKPENIPAIYNPPRGVRLVPFESIADVLATLQFAPTSRFNPEAKPFVPSAVVEPADVEPVEDDSAPDEPFRDGHGTVENFASNDLSIERTKEETAAANIIQTWYRGRMAARTLATSETTSRLHIYAIAQIEVNKLHVSLSYRCMFLGPLPHVLTALKGCEKALSGKKKMLKKRFHGTGSLDLDEVHNLITKCNQLVKTQIRIWKDLEPISKFHCEGSVENLKERVRDVSNLVEGTLAVAPSMEKYLWDMEVGYKGIVQVAPSPPPSPPPEPTAKVPKRPSLNTEDLDDW